MSNDDGCGGCDRKWAKGIVKPQIIIVGWVKRSETQHQRWLL
ncbi:hypothetical protein [Nostoc sp. CHAB 5836]|nr:hypothetical protein [Nostoc sp. CHAB 5836]